MDTPKIPAPKDEGEKQVLDKLVAIRDQLQLRKLDRTTYVRTQDVMVLYDQVLEQVKRLNEIRGGKATEEIQENRVDRVVDSCFQLLSLFFMTIGRNNEAPAAYALTSTIKRLLDHLTEADLFSAKDLESMSQTLEHLSDIVNTTPDTQSAPYLETLIAKRIERCRASLTALQKKIEDIAVPLRPTAEKLVSVLRQMAVINTKSKVDRTNFPADIHRYVAQLRDISDSRKDGHFVDEDGNKLKGSDKVVALMERCQLYTGIILEKNGTFPDKWRPVYDVLIGIRNELDKLSLTQAWSLRETDLYDFQRQLDKIDESRVDGNWVDDEGQPAELYVQRTLLYLIRRCYGYIYHLMLSSEPVSEALLPIYNQLQTLKRCLVEVKKCGVSSVRELYPYSMKLNSIDNMRVDGKFMVGEDIPEGQGSVTTLLADCFDLNYELRVAAEASEESNDSTPGSRTPDV
ncbi:Uu.00g102050.m01.CDS01 [Anthostomella pinea]|uniref:Uu.00g102050.m01.CDS01 n=1 Tax=Anthostomella pinea TaxID=933095 RepID=A0AAI8VEB0_9PEZI|nr:Uu.00g102050.m01.CDS01 [Anthostomella pinea]